MVLFPFTSFSGFVLSKCLQPSFVVLHLFSWHVRATEQMCLHLRHQPLLRIWGLLTVLFLTLKGQDFGPVQSTKSTYSYHSSYKTRPGSRIASRRLLRQWPPTKITNISQIVGSLVARVTSLETNAASGSSSPYSARSWNMFGQ